MRISNLLILATIVAIGILSAGSANAQDTESANSLSAIIADITLTKTSDMNFGDVIAGAGTVVLSASSSPGRSATGDTELGNSTGVSSAIFTVTGEGTSTYSITLPTSDITITESGTSQTMIVNSFTSSPIGTGTLSSGSQTLYVGATLNVSAGQTAAADYTGSFNVTVAYN